MASNASRTMISRGSWCVSYLDSTLQIETTIRPVLYVGAPVKYARYSTASVAAILLISCVSSTLHATSIAPETSWMRKSQNGRYVLVMISPDESWETEDSLRLRENYTQSGVYRNDGSAELLWQVPYQTESIHIHVALNGQHVVADRGDELVLYHQNSSPQAFANRDLLRLVALKSIFADGLSRNAVVFHPLTLTCHIETHHGESLWIDVPTGEVILHDSLWPFYIAIPILVVPLFVVVRCRRGFSRDSATRFWWQLSLQDVLVLVTFVSVFLAIFQGSRQLGLLFAAVAIISGAMATQWSGHREGWIVGPVLSLFVAFLGALTGAIAVDILVALRPGSGWDSGGLLGTLATIGSITGACLAGHVISRYSHNGAPS